MSTPNVLTVDGRTVDPGSTYIQLGDTLGCYRNKRLGFQLETTGEWRGDLYRADLTGTELSELTVGLIGYGEIGTRVVPLLKPFGCRILVCDPYKELSAQDAADGVVMTDLASCTDEYWRCRPFGNRSM